MRVGFFVIVGNIYIIINVDIVINDFVVFNDGNEINIIGEDVNSVVRRDSDGDFEFMR